MFETITNCSPGWSGSWAICKINVKRQSTRLKQGSEYWIHKKNWPAIIFQLSFTSYFLKTVSMSSGSQWSAETWHSCAQVKQTVRIMRKILVSKVSLGYFCFSPRVQVSFTRHDAPKSFFFFFAMQFQQCLDQVHSLQLSTHPPVWLLATSLLASMFRLSISLSTAEHMFSRSLCQAWPLLSFKPHT